MSFWTLVQLQERVGSYAHSNFIEDCASIRLAVDTLLGCFAMPYRLQKLYITGKMLTSRVTCADADAFCSFRDGRKAHNCAESGRSIRRCGRPLLASSGLCYMAAAGQETISAEARFTYSFSS